jgi:sugar phosphate isomerase/epimerase
MKLGYRVNTPEAPQAPRLRGLHGDTEDCFALLADIGYTGVELCVADPAAGLARAETWLRLADRHGLRIVAVSTDLLVAAGGAELLSTDQAAFEAARVTYRAAVELAGALECVVDLGPALGSPPEDEPRSVTVSRACSVVIGPHASYAADMGTWVLLKPVCRPHCGWLRDIAAARHVAVRANWPTVRLALDSGMLDLSEADAWDQLRAAAPLVRHVTLSGPEGQAPSAETPGLAKLLSELAAHGYDGWYVAAACDERPAEAAHQAYTYLSKVLPA